MDKCQWKKQHEEDASRVRFRHKHLPMPPGCRADGHTRRPNLIGPASTDRTSLFSDPRRASGKEHSLNAPITRKRLGATTHKVRKLCIVSAGSSHARIVRQDAHLVPHLLSFWARQKPASAFRAGGNRLLLCTPSMPRQNLPSSR